MIAYKISKNARILFVGINPHPGSYRRGVPFSNNKMFWYGGIIPFTATFLIFSDYMRPPIRLAALMELGLIYIFTHDSIALGQDGPTHQPIEQLASVRAIPELIVIRPCDANETAVAWRVAIETRDRPVALILTRQNVPTLDRTQFAAAEGLRRGAYILEDAPEGKPDLILIGTGSEVSLIFKAGKKLTKEGTKVRIVSMPSWKLFDCQPQSYRDSVLALSTHARLAVEAGAPQGWSKYMGREGDVIGVERFGASAPGAVVMDEYGFTVENVCERAMELVNGKRPVLH